MAIDASAGLRTIPRRALLAMMLPGMLAACGGSSVVPTKDPEYVGHTVRVIAIAPPESLVSTGSMAEGGVLGDDIGAELAKHGYKIVDAMAAAAILDKNDVTSLLALAPRGLAALEKDGIDAVLTVKSASSTIGGPGMRHVTARINSTHSSKVIASVDWNNSWGGMPGSLADYTMRKGAAAAAQEIAEALAKLLG